MIAIFIAGGLLIIFRVIGIELVQISLYTIFDALALIFLGISLSFGMSGICKQKKQFAARFKLMMGGEALLFIVGIGVLILGALEIERYKSYYKMHLFFPLTTYLQSLFFIGSSLFIILAGVGIIVGVRNFRTKTYQGISRYVGHQLRVIGILFLLGVGIGMFPLISTIRMGNFGIPIGFHDPAYDLPTQPHVNSALDSPSVNQTLITILERALWAMTRIQQQGGFPMKVTLDGAKYYGDRGKTLPYYPGEISLQGSTGNIGEVYLAMYQLEPNPIYLNVCTDVAKALMAVQDPTYGGFYYDGWIREDGSAVHPHPLNPTQSAILDDNTMQSCMRFLLDYYNLTKDPEILGSLLFGFDCIDAMETPIGGWMQRSNYGKEEYPSRVTLNDGCLRNTVELFLHAYDILGDDHFLQAALRAGDFLIKVQGQGGSVVQTAWAEQYDYEGFPAWGRVFEPPGFSPDATRDAIDILLLLYRRTGNTTYLTPIPDALTWLMDASTILHEEENGINFTCYARLYEQQTNCPIYGTENGGEGRCREYTYEVNQAKKGYTWQNNFSVPQLIERLQYFASIEYNCTLMEQYYLSSVNLEAMEITVNMIASDLDPSGFWISENLISDQSFWMNALTMIYYFIRLIA